jgi:hypothetical protein
MQNDPVEEIAKRTQRYWFEDGLWEIAFGLVNALLAGFYFLVLYLDRLGISGGIVLVLQMVVIVGAFLGMGRLVKFFKERITYPRTGFVAYHKPSPVTRLKRILRTIFISAFMAALISMIAVIQLNRGLNLTALVTGALLAAALVYFGYRFDLVRMYLIASLVFLLGLALSLSPIADELAIAVFFAGLGLLMILSGGITLAIYLRSSQTNAGDQSDYESPLDNR